MSFAQLIKDTFELLKEESEILASSDDAAFFRFIAKKTLPEKTAQKKLIDPLPKVVIPEVAKETIVMPQVPVNEPLTKEPIAAKEVISPPKPVFVSEQQLPAAVPLNTGSLKALYQKLFPQLPLIQTIPSDATAKKIANRWKTKNQAAPISILYFSEPSLQKDLLIAITKAIDVYFGPARIIQAETIEKEKQWDTFLSSDDLKLVIACDYTLWQLTNLMQYFKETPQRTLKNVPLFLLPDLSLYLKDSSLKRSLWKAIQKTLCATSVQSNFGFF